MKTILVKLPLKCKGFIYEDCETGYKCCILNQNHSYETNKKTYEHELKHIKNNDFECCEDINTIEYNSHN